MADIWSGEILLPEGGSLTDISLASQTVASSLALPTTPLNFLSTVDTSRIPLYLAAGPSLDVWTTSEDTAQWFHGLLLNEAATTNDAAEAGKTQAWWTFARAQSPVGILTQVVADQDVAKGPRITEILFYGTIAASATTAIPTPPSSSPGQHIDGSEEFPELRVHALPLSSDLLYKHVGSDSALHQGQQEPQFLSRQPCLELPRAPSPKRKRDLFDEAAQFRKTARRKGGEGVAAAAAKANDSMPAYAHRKSSSIDARAPNFSDSRPVSATGALSRPPSRALSRSPSMCSEIRPLSRKGLAEGRSRRTTLSQMATAPLHMEEPTIETRNKEALSRVVMTAMRMHGFQPRKKPRSRGGSIPPGIDATSDFNEDTAAAEAAKDEEYKLIYHQTYKGAALALRKHIATKPLHSSLDLLRDVVERLLAIFCIDPLSVSLPADDASNVLVTPGGSKRLAIPGSTGASPFDAPSAGRLPAGRSLKEMRVPTESPIRRRSSNDKEPLLE